MSSPEVFRRKRVVRPEPPQETEAQHARVNPDDLHGRIDARQYASLQLDGKIPDVRPAKDMGGSGVVAEHKRTKQEEYTHRGLQKINTKRLAMYRGLVNAAFDGRPYINERGEEVTVEQIWSIFSSDLLDGGWLGPGQQKKILEKAIREWKKELGAVLQELQRKEEIGEIDTAYRVMSGTEVMLRHKIRDANYRVMDLDEIMMASVPQPEEPSNMYDEIIDALPFDAPKQ